MKWIFYVIVFVYMFYRAVYSLKTNDIVTSGQIILDDNVQYEDGIFVEAGERKVINCKAPGKNQKVKWINPKGQEISRIQSKRVYAQYLVQSPHAQTTSLMLNITEAEVHDSGIWVCRVGDLVKSVSICVIDPTDFQGTQSEVAADEGRSYTLSCLTKGTPDAMISWSRNGEVISDNDDEDMPKYKVMTKFNSPGIEGLLTIMSLNVDDSGVYTCESTQKTKLADKCKSIRTFNITLNIKHAPSFGEKKKDKVYGVAGETLYLRCEADGFPQPSYQWFILSDEEELTRIADKEVVTTDDGTGSVLPVKVVEDTYDHQYICKASNELDEDEFTFNILKKAKPEKPAEVELVDVPSSKSLVFNITWDDEIEFDIDTIEIQYMPTALLPKKRAVEPRERDWKHHTPYAAAIGQVLEDSALATLLDLEPSTEYWVRLRIKNDVGISPWSSPIKATTQKSEDDDEEKDPEEEEPQEEEEQTETQEESATTEAQPDASEKDTSNSNAPEESGRFYGLFFALGIIIIAVGCTFLVKMV